MAGQAQFKLRAFCHLDRIQPQFAAFVGKIASGAPPVEGESTLYVEMVPGIWVYRIVDRVLKAVDVQPSAQMVEREFGMLAVHAFSQANVLRAGEVVSRAEIWEQLYDFNQDPESNVVDVFVAYLRRKIEREGKPKLIHTRRGMGYILEERPETAGCGGGFRFAPVCKGGVGSPQLAVGR